MALIQAVLGVEFLLTGLSKFADRRYFANFQTFVLTSPGSQQGIIAALIKAIVLPHATLAAQAARFAELTAGLVLLITAAETVRRRLQGSLATRHPYEPAAALLAAVAGLTVAGMSFAIYLIQGAGIPEINPAKAFASAITVELMIVPLGLAIAWMQWTRFRALRRSAEVPPQPRAIAA